MASAAPMENTLPEAGRPMPLECILCPKKPSFSDTSHLLTHVASKSHLHQKFNTEFKAKTEPDARERLEKYEAWYADNDIERLLSERIAAKEQRKPSRRGRSSTAASDKSRLSISTASIKADFDSTSGYTTPNNLQNAAQWNPVLAGQYPDSGFIDETIYQTPVTGRHRSSFPFPDEMSGQAAELKSRGMLSDLQVSLGIDLLDVDAQANKLKGTVWPGMALFDSATPDQKRKRNQRKDGAVVEQMKLTSEAVLATETVWGPDGDVRKIRDIYASPSIDGSPPSTPPMKRKYRMRDTTPTRAGKNQTNYANGNEDVFKTQHDDQSSLGASAARRARSSAKTGAKPGRKKKISSLDDDPIDMHGASFVKGSFDVLCDDPGNSPGAGESSLEGRFHDNGFDSGHQQRPALQQLDPNLGLSESSGYFKSYPSRFFENGAESPNMPYRTGPPSGFGGTFHGMSNSMTGLCAQPRMPGTLNNQMLGGNNANEDGSNLFHPTAGRRLSYGGFGVDPNSSTFGFGEERDASLRESSFADSTFRNSSGLFDM